MEDRLTTNKISLGFSLVFSTFCIVACSYQLISVTVNYMMFRVSSRVLFTIPEDLPAPALSACFHYVEVIDIDLFNKLHNESVTHDPSKRERRLIKSIVSIKDIFDLTPLGRVHRTTHQNSSIFNKCLVHANDDYSVMSLDDYQCSQHVFNIKRYHIQDNICYRFILKHDWKKRIQNFTYQTNIDSEKKDINYNFERLSFSLTSPSLFFQIFLSIRREMFERADFILPVVHSAHGHPYTSLSLAPSLFRLRISNKSKSTKIAVRSISSTYGLVIVRKLPFPYETKCIEIAFDTVTGKNVQYSSSSCQNICLTRKLTRSLGKLPFMIMSKESVIVKNNSINPALQLVLAEDFKNETIAQILNDTENQCREMCAAPACTLDYTLTETRISKGGSKNDLQFSVLSPQSPTLKITFLPLMHFNDLLIQSLSLIGFWLGMSMHAINPTNRLEKLISKYCKSPNRRRTFLPKKIHKYCKRTRNIFKQQVKDEITLLIADIAKSGHHIRHMH